MRTEGAVLIGRRDGEFWFVDSVFEHGDGLSGCTGMTVYPVSEACAEEALSDDSLADRYCSYWHEVSKELVSADCSHCEDEPNEEGCEDCGYQSLKALCDDLRQYDGYDAVFDYPGYEYEEAIAEHVEDMETVDCSGCGRMFGRPRGNDGRFDFDEVYNYAALIACICYESGRISYDQAVNVIYPK
jgi:hypothetical protein